MPHDRDAAAVAHIRQIERENDHNYALQKIYEELNDKGIKTGRSRVQRIMHNNGIKAQIKSKYKPQTTKADPNAQAYDNLLDQNFEVQDSNMVWLADLTFRVGGKWCYLAAVLDLGRRKLVGWYRHPADCKIGLSGTGNGDPTRKDSSGINPSFRAWKSIYIDGI